MLVHHTNAVALGLQLYLKGNSGTGVSCEFYEISKNIFFHRTPLVAASADKKEALAQLFSCEFYEISKNTLFHRTPLVAASVDWQSSTLTSSQQIRRS